LQILANVLVFYYGTSPNKFFDYLASGLPVLNNYPGWLAEIITRHQCGYAVQPDDPVAFAVALCHAADHRTELVAFGARAWELAVAEFDPERLAGRFVACLEGAVAPGSTASKEPFNNK
jgi:glycosyltransferase involved in cell wall biosynthesis